MAGLASLQVFFVLGILCYLTFLLLVFKWRNNFPLCKREPNMIMFQIFLLGLFGSLVLVFPGFYAAETITCLDVNVSVICLFYAVFLSVLLRVVYLWNLDFQTFLVNKFHHVAGKLENNTEKSCSGRLQLWYFKNRKFFGMPLFYLIALLAEVEVIVNSYTFFKNLGGDKVYRGSPECRRIFGSGSTKVLYFLRFLITAGLLLSLLFNLRKLKDNFGLLSEIKVTIGVMVAMLVYFLIASQVQSILASPLHFILFGFVLEIAWMCLVVLPVLRWSRNWSRQHPIELKESNGTSIGEEVKPVKPRVRNVKETLQLLDRVLKHPTGYELLYRFLQSEFALENILFWKSSQEFVIEFNESTFAQMSSKEEASSKLIEQAQELMTKYVNNDAVMCINLSSDCRHDLIKISETLLDDNLQERVKAFSGALLAAQKEVLKMMAMDSFVRFRETPSFKEFAIDTLLDDHLKDEKLAAEDKKGTTIQVQVVALQASTNE
jgi:hypothetical protein